MNRKVVISQKTVSIPAGNGGYKFFSFQVKTSGKEEHVIFFDVSVIQPAGRQDLDINFFVFDEANFQKWLSNVPNTAFLLIPRHSFGELIFKPPSSGRYYAVLNNQYSFFTSKTVRFTVYETWLDEKMEQEAEQDSKLSHETETSRLKNLFNKLRHSKTIGLIGLLLVVQITCFLIAGLIILLFNFTFGLEYKDIIGYIAASVGPCALVMFFALYHLHTGKTLTTTKA